MTIGLDLDDDIPWIFQLRNGDFDRFAGINGRLDLREKVGKC